MDIRLKQLSFGSQAKAALAIAAFAAPVLFLLLIVMQSVGWLPGRPGRVYSPMVIVIATALLSLIFAAAFALLNLAALWLLRLVPWRGPRLRVADSAALARLFD